MDLNGVQWRTSSFSNSDDGNNCVEVAYLPGGEVAVRRTSTGRRRGARSWQLCAPGSSIIAR